MEGPELQGWRPGHSWARQGRDWADGLTSCPWAGQCHTQPHGLKLPWGEVLPSLAEYGWKRRKVLCCGHHVCSSCWRGPWGTAGLQRSEAVRNWAHIQLQWGLVRLNHERHLAEVRGGHPAPGTGCVRVWCVLREVRLAFSVQRCFCWKVKTCFGKQMSPVGKRRCSVLVAYGFPCPAGGNAGIQATTRGFFH